MGVDKDVRAGTDPGAVLKQYWKYFLDPSGAAAKITRAFVPPTPEFLCNMLAFSSGNRAWTVQLFLPVGVMAWYL